MKIFVEIQIRDGLVPAELALGGFKIERDETEAAAALEASRRLALVGREAVEAGAQKRAKPRAT